MISIITSQFGKPDKAEITNISITINSFRFFFKLIRIQKEKK